MSETADVPARLTFEFDGKPVEARAGDSIAAALSDAGISAYRHTRQGQPRGMFCGMGVCADCLVIVNGRRSQRACMVEAHPGLRVQSQQDAKATPAQVEASVEDRCDMPDAPEKMAPAVVQDLIVLGAGPAGMQAALLASAAGLRVTLIDERDAAGGQYYKPRSQGSRAVHALDRQHLNGQALRQRVAASTVNLRLGETVWFARGSDEGDGFELRTVREAVQHRYESRALIVATGAYERPAIVPGWTLPGVMTIGAGQTLVRRYGVTPGKKVVIAGHGPLGLQLAYEMSLQGVDVVALLERSTPRFGRHMMTAASLSPALLLLAARYRLRLKRRGIPVLYAHEITRLLGEDRLEQVEYANRDTGQTQLIDVDWVFAGDGFAPQCEVVRLLGCAVNVDAATGATSVTRDLYGASDVPGLWIAGDAGRLQGAVAAEAQGRLAAERACEYLGARCEKSPRSLTTLQRAHRFQTALWSLYEAPPRQLPAEETLVCRCESVSMGQLNKAMEQGAVSLAGLKAATRLGMGRCQGRYCVPTATRLLQDRGQVVHAQSLFAPQLPVRPVPIAALEQEKPEWSGHRESQPAARPAIGRTQPLQATRTDVLVIGGGVTGVCASLFAARDGASVMCVDRGSLNGEASGGNAGSLHLQLLSWDFGSKAAGDGSAALATLAMQQESIALWKTLEQQLDADFEMQTTGGMMVAESHSQIAFLENKVAAEGRVGVQSEVIDAVRMRDIMPAISPRMVAAAWCPGEGKINPLIAGPLLINAAKQAGVQFEERTAVNALQRDGQHYRVTTPHGEIVCSRVIIAAGGWSAGIAAMLGAAVPVRGAPLQMIVTEPAPPLVPCLLAHADRHLTLKQARAGSLIIGGAWTAETAPGGQTRILPDSLEGNLWVAARTIPQARDLHVIRSWAAMNIDIDGAPLLGPLPGHPGVVVAATANGYTLGPLMGREAAAVALRGHIPASLKRFGLERFNHQRN